MLEGDRRNISKVQPTGPEELLDDIVNIIKNVFWQVIDDEAEANVDIILTFPALLSISTDTRGTVCSNTETSGTGILALQALALS